MCFGGNQQQQPAPVTPAPAPAPAAPAPQETQVGQGRKAQNLADFGTAQGPSLRTDRSVDVPGSGSGLNM